MTDARELRAGNAERTAVTTSLRQAYADGRLAETELAERLDATHAARTLGDLDRIVADLPISPPSKEFAPTEPVSSAASPTGLALWPQLAPGAMGTSPENPLVIEGGWTNATRRGRWAIPRFLRLRGGMGSVKLDCTEATTAHQVIHLWIEGDMGSITVVVPEGWAANVDGLRKSWGTIKVKVASDSTMGRPTMVVNGSMGMGSFRIRHPNWFERRRLEKRLR